MTATYPVVTIPEFLDIVKKLIMEDFDRVSKEEIVDILLECGVVKFDKEFINKFVKGLPIFVYLPTMFVDVGDNMFYWMVSGNDAMVVKKP